MKKIVAISLAMVAAVASHAASVEWTSGDLAALSTKTVDKDIRGVTAYYYVISADDYATLAAMTSEELYYNYFNQDGTQKGTAAAVVPMNAMGLANWVQNDPTTPTAYVAAVYVAKSAFGGSYALAGTAYATFDSDSEFEEPVGGTFADIAETVAGSSSSPWAPVPEPTTVALLALGLAAVGLKRKVA